MPGPKRGLKPTVQGSIWKLSLAYANLTYGLSNDFTNHRRSMVISICYFEKVIVMLFQWRFFQIGFKSIFKADNFLIECQMQHHRCTWLGMDKYTSSTASHFYEVIWKVLKWPTCIELALARPFLQGNMCCMCATLITRRSILGCKVC